MGDMMQNITIGELLKLKNINLIDIRTEQKYNNNHIPGAINIPMSKLLNTPNNYLDKTQKYYIYCWRGNNSSMVCETLARKGYKTINVIGGYEEWILKNNV